MKLLRYGPAGQEKPGLLDSNNQIRDLSAVVLDISGQALLPELAYFVLFLPMLLVLIFRPQGLFGRQVP